MRDKIDRYTIHSASLCGWLLAVLMVFLLAEIVCRTANHPLIGIAEFSMFIMLTTVYLGLGNCERKDGHVKVEFLTDKMQPATKRVFAVGTGALSVLTMGLCTYAMTVNAIESYFENEAMAGLVPYQVWPVKCIMAVGILLYFLQVLVRFLDNVKAQGKPADAAERSAQ